MFVLNKMLKRKRNEDIEESIDDLISINQNKIKFYSDINPALN